MNKSVLARGILAAALLAALIWGMWLIPLEPPHGHPGHSPEETWNLPPILPPDNLKQLAQNVADRQGWTKDAAAKGKTALGNPTTPAGTQGKGTNAILGIGQVGRDAAIIIAEGPGIHAYRPGDTLPDGRRILGIHGLHIQLTGPEGEQTLRLFPYAEPKPAP